MVFTTIKTDGDTARNVRQILSEHYDLEVKYRHTPDGKDLYVELVLYSKGSLSVEKPPKRKHNRIPR